MSSKAAGKACLRQEVSCDAGAELWWTIDPKYWRLGGSTRLIEPHFCCRKTKQHQKVRSKKARASTPRVTPNLLERVRAIDRVHMYAYYIHFKHHATSSLNPVHVVFFNPTIPLQHSNRHPVQMIHPNILAKPSWRDKRVLKKHDNNDEQSILLKVELIIDCGLHHAWSQWK